MSKVALAHEMVRFNGSFNVMAMDSYCDAHEHVLWALSNTTANAEKIRAFQGFESEAGYTVSGTCQMNRGNSQVIIKVTIVDYSRIEYFGVGTDNVIHCF